MWTIYKPGCNSKNRSTVMSADNRETVHLELPSRSNWGVESVTAYTGSGEVDTQAVTNSGVAPLTWWNLARISEDDKKAVLGHAVAKPDRKIYDATMGQPLFWNDRKSITYWKSLIKRFKIKRAINFSPGGGMLERACLELGVPCVAVCKNPTHLNLFLNVLDRASMSMIVTKGSAMYDPDSKVNVQRLFQDILDRMTAQDTDDTEMPCAEE